MIEDSADGTAQKQQQTWESNNTIRCSSYWGESPQDGLRVVQTCGTTLASAYMLHYLSATWSQLLWYDKVWIYFDKI